MSTFCFSRLAKWPMSLNLFCSNNVTFNECFPHLIFLQHQMSFSFAEKDMMPIKLYEKKRFFKDQHGCIFYKKKPLNYDQIMFHHFVYENSPVYGSIGRLFIPQFCWWCHHQNIVYLLRECRGWRVLGDGKLTILSCIHLFLQFVFINWLKHLVTQKNDRLFPFSDSGKHTLMKIFLMIPTS